MKYKILTICAGANVRSVGLKYLLKYKYGHEALACGQDSNTQETRDLLSEWADYIIVVTQDYLPFISERFKDKTFCYEVGEDRFGYAFHPELLQICDQLIQNHGLFNKTE